MWRRGNALGVTLFLRTRRRLLLTDTGRSYAAASACTWSRSSAYAGNPRGPRRGYVLHLAVVSTFCTQWLIPRLPQFAALHPHHRQPVGALRGLSFDESGFDAAIYFGDRLWPDTQGCMVVPKALRARVQPAVCAAHPLHDEAAAALPAPHAGIARQRLARLVRRTRLALHAARLTRAAQALFSMVIAPSRRQSGRGLGAAAAGAGGTGSRAAGCRRTRRNCRHAGATGSCSRSTVRARTHCRRCATGWRLRPGRARPERLSSSPCPRSGWAWG